MANGAVHRFFGGPPLSVAVRLILLCILVGFVLHQFGYDPWNIWRSLGDLVRKIQEMGWDAVTLVGRYLMLGAVIVVPIWIVVRLAKAGRS